MPKTVVSALYNFRDVKDKEDSAAGVAQNATRGGGGGGGERGRRKSSSNGSRVSTSTGEKKQMGSALRRCTRLI